jgi:biotin carboxyl carrier protein
MTQFENRYVVTVDDEEFDISLRKAGDGLQIDYKGKTYNVAVDKLGDKKVLLKIDAGSSEVDIFRNGRGLNVFLEGKEMVAKVEPYNLAELRKSAGSALKDVEDKVVKAPMPGLVLVVNVKRGDIVKKGMTLVIIEAMKMENMIKAAHDGKVKEVFVISGKAVDKNEKLLELE